MSGKTWLPAWHSQIDFLDRHQNSDVKIVWELNRLQFLALLGIEYRRTGDEDLVHRMVRVVCDWDKNNPVGWTVAWTCAMDCAIRAISLIWTRALFASSPSVSTTFWNRLIRMLAEHSRFIFRNLEYSDVRGNHYSSNLIGLYYCALALPWCAESPDWHSLARSGLESEIFHQVHPDGGTHEGSVPYHRLVTEIFLHAAILGTKVGNPFPRSYLDRLRSMFHFIVGYTRPDGLAPLIGDNDSGKIQFLGGQHLNDHRYLVRVGAVLFPDDDFESVGGRHWEESFWLLSFAGLDPELSGAKRDSKPFAKSVGFADSGLWILRAENSYVAVDCGDVGMRGRGGHGHNDTLSVEISLAGASLIVDPGTFCYSSSRARRIDNLSAATHNCPIVNGAEPSTVDDYFLPTVTAYDYSVDTWNPCPTSPSFQGRHYGYRSDHGVIVCRDVSLKKFEVLIEDRFLGEGEVELSWTWTFAPGVTVRLSDGSAALSLPNREFLFTCSHLRDVAVQDTSYYPHYGIEVPTISLAVRARVALPYEVTFTLSVQPPTRSKPNHA